ncbi:hypothetical protein AQJ67_04905 [Streptomyces caeruleatus]|uniref:Uncharacterized protein n=1 Tax=Streptomyces caeruleatus TaxID=661399 RepID=A0A101U8V8_9ACTN|nr:hypothetical protein AQJ67_04905 [Streptomyces caeruleatus]
MSGRRSGGDAERHQVHQVRSQVGLPQLLGPALTAGLLRMVRGDQRGLEDRQRDLDLARRIGAYGVDVDVRSQVLAEEHRGVAHADRSDRTDDAGGRFQVGQGGCRAESASRNLTRARAGKVAVRLSSVSWIRMRSSGKTC